MSRRTVLAMLALAGVATAVASLAQQRPRIWRIGFLSPRGPATATNPDVYDAFMDGMRKLGYVEGKNIIVEWRYANGLLDRLPALAEELARLRVDLIVTAGTQATQAAQQVTSSIPIVIGSATDPVGSGFVSSLARPGGNVTGLSLTAVDVSAKHVELIKTVNPSLSRLAVLVNPSNTAHPSLLSRLRANAEKAGLQVFVAEARAPDDIERAFAAMKRDRAEALIVAPDSLFLQRREQVAQLALKNRLPSVNADRGSLATGGLMSYGQDLNNNFRRAASYVDRILRGANPGELPMEQPLTYYLAINVRVAEALGLKIPAELLLKADEVIR
jgi:putative tryptophan/tyrosine transport system substrate-binding protein